MYSIVEETGKTIKKAKGVKKIVVKKDIKHDHYKSDYSKINHLDMI